MRGTTRSGTVILERGGVRTHVCDEYGLLERDIRQGQIAPGHSGFVRFSGELVFFMVDTLEVRGDVSLPVAGCTEELLAVRTRERPNT